MTTDELKAKGGIYFEKIGEGLSRYKEIKLVMDHKKAYNHFKSLKKEYGEGTAFADFYYYRLDDDSRDMVNELLTVEDIQYLGAIAPASDQVDDQIIFELDDRLLKIIVKLNAEEMLFSTIYFTPGKDRAATTWWGNYEKEYICFK